MYKKLGFGLAVGVFIALAGVMTMSKFVHKNEISSLSHKSGQSDVKDHEQYNELDVIFGDLDAPIKIIEYTSLNCAHCAHFHQVVFPELKKKYIETGEIVLIVKHFPLDSQALEAASLLASFPKFRQVKLLDEIFNKQSEWLGQDYLDKLSSLCKLSPEECKRKATDEKVSNSILEAQLTAGKKFKITATPTFVINGRIVPYAPTLEEIETFVGKAPKAP